MTVPASPTEGGGKKILFLTYDNGGANAAALIHGKNAQTVNSETYADMVVTLDGETVSVAWNGITTPTHSAPNATVTSGTILAANANRLYALIINDSDTTVYLAMGTPSVVSQGIRLNANGGGYELGATLGNLYTGAITAIHGASGNKQMLVTEGV